MALKCQMKLVNEVYALFYCYVDSYALLAIVYGTQETVERVVHSQQQRCRHWQASELGVVDFAQHDGALYIPSAILLETYSQVLVPLRCCLGVG